MISSHDFCFATPAAPAQVWVALTDITPQDFSFKIAHTIAMIHEGRIIFRGGVEETQETDNAIVRNFVTGGEG